MNTCPNLLRRSRFACGPVASISVSVGVGRTMPLEVLHRLNATARELRTSRSKLITLAVIAWLKRNKR